MPVIISNDLPSQKWLELQHVFYMAKKRASKQDIRPLKAAVVNLMPTKEDTEKQFLKLLSSTPLQIELCFLHMNSHNSKTTDKSHMQKYYKTPREIMKEKFDIMIITGAPVEQIGFEEVDYWPELAQLMDYTKRNVFCTVHVCWGAQAALYYHYGVQKHPLKSKCFGIYRHEIDQKSPLFWGFDSEIVIPHSRYTEVREAEIKKVKGLKIEAASKEVGPAIVSAANGRQIFIVGHMEYDADTLDKEYKRDIKKGLKTVKPKNYYNKKGEPESTWRTDASLFYNNIINLVYQQTPYDLEELSAI